MKFEIKNRFNGDVQFSCELSAEVAGKSYAIQLGFAVKKAIDVKADLRSADLSYADLRSADLSYADLRYADLRSADLSYADLRYADLRSADLSYADLRSADLSYADLRSADLSYADLRYADLRSADLRSADLRYAKNSEMAIALTRILPDGDLIGWKKCRDGVIVKLRIPEAAKRCHAFGRKCRAEFADVIEVIGGEHGVSLHDGKTKYVAGNRVMPDSFDEDFTNECSNGVHFYITKLEAETHS